MPRKRGKKKRKGGGKKPTNVTTKSPDDVDDDVAAFLGTVDPDTAKPAATAVASAADNPSMSPAASTAETAPADDDADVLQFLGLDDDPTSTAKKKKKKKKKKPKKPAEPAKKKESAVARRYRLAQEAKKKQEAEEKAALEAENERIRKENEEKDKKAEKKRLKRQKKKERDRLAKLKEGSKKSQKRLAGRRGRLNVNRAAFKKSENKPEKKPEKQPVTKPDPVEDQTPVAVETPPPMPAAAAAATAQVAGSSWEDLVDDKSGKKDADDGPEILDWEDASFDLNMDFGDGPTCDVEEPQKAPAKPPPTQKNAPSPKKATKKKKMSKKEKREKRAQQKRKVNSSDEDSDGDGEADKLEKLIEASRVKLQVARREARMKRVEENLRSPICCVMGHVDTGKTLLLDKLRQTNVQKGEFGGITQQIGATFMPIATLKKKMSTVNEDYKFSCRLPGLLMIDTPGHKSFSNLRSRGSSLCDIAILVVDIMHSMEQQTIESIQMLRKRRTPFIVALNKVDRLYDWKVCGDSPIRDALAKQEDHVLEEFRTRVKRCQTGLMEQGLNSELYFDNKDWTKVVSICPISAMTGEGIQDLLLHLLQLTQEKMTQKLMYTDFVQCIVLELKVIDGLGPTVDVMLVNGQLKAGDTMVFCTINGPVVTKVRALLTPPVMRDARIKSDYIRHDHITGSMGVKIAAEGLEQVVAGSECLVYTPEYELDHFKELVMEGMSDLSGLLRKDGRGVRVHASTLGSLEALLTFLRAQKPPIPVGGFGVGPIFKKDVIQASTMLEKKRAFATILAFDVKIDPEAAQMADDMGVRVFTANIIYHLQDQFQQYLQDLRQSARDNSKPVFPCVLQILDQFIFNKKNPIVVGVKVLEGIVKSGTPLCVIKEDSAGTRSVLTIGTIGSLQLNNKPVQSARSPEEICIKIDQNQAENFIMYGRQFDHKHKLFSVISRASIDALKANFREDLKEPEDTMLIVKLKKMFNII